MKKKEKRKHFVSCIVAAGGKGTRMGAEVNKIFLDLLGSPILAHTLTALNECELIDEIIVVASGTDILGCSDIVREFGINKVKTITVGGSTRQRSVKNGISEVSEKADIVVVHDAARPLCEADKLCEVINAAFEFGAAALGTPEKNTLKHVDENGFISHTVDRSHIYGIHTPQVFEKDMLVRIHENAEINGISATDDCYLAEIMGEKVKMVEDSYGNIKITTADDLIVAERMLEGRMNG